MATLLPPSTAYVFLQLFNTLKKYSSGVRTCLRLRGGVEGRGVGNKGHTHFSRYHAL